MEIRVSGHQIETGEALQAHVSDRMNAIADKYFSRAIGAHANWNAAGRTWTQSGNTYIDNGAPVPSPF